MRISKRRHLRTTSRDRKPSSAQGRRGPISRPLRIEQLELRLALSDVGIIWSDQFGGIGFAHDQALSVFAITVTPVNDPPLFSSFAGPVATTLEDTEVGITFAGLAEQGDATDVDGTVTAFVVVARDDSGADSATPVTVQVTVTPVNRSVPHRPGQSVYIRRRLGRRSARNVSRCRRDHRVAHVPVDGHCNREGDSAG